MTFLPHNPRRAVPSEADKARASHFGDILWVSGKFDLRCWREAEALTNRLAWQRRLYRLGKVEP
jgi:hypothetical protein